MTGSAFGCLPSGAAVGLNRIEAGDLALEVIAYGAAIRSLQVRGVEVVLGFPDLDSYLADRAYHGVIAGRFANRIAGAGFEIDERSYQVSANEGANCLHGGTLGFSRRLWRFDEIAADRLRLVYTSPDGEDGFPGTVEAAVAFQLHGDALEITWSATTDAPTPINLTHHPYFNLGGDPTKDVLDHRLSIRADAITPVREDLIPTGAIMSVTDTAFDLRVPRTLRDVVSADHPQLAIAGGYDHNWVLQPGTGPALTLESPDTGLRLELETDQPGVQIYSGQGLGPPFTRFGGLVIEPQNFPDAVNQPAFPDAILRPGAPYRRRALYRFASGKA